MMDINDAISYFEQYVDNDLYTDKHKAACKMAIDALRAQQKADQNNQLALNELLGMDSQPVWIESRNGDFGWELSEDAVDYFEGRDAEQYGDTWVAYRRPPYERT